MNVENIQYEIRRLTRMKEGLETCIAQGTAVLLEVTKPGPGSGRVQMSIDYRLNEALQRAITNEIIYLECCLSDYPEEQSETD